MINLIIFLVMFSFAHAAPIRIIGHTSDSKYILREVTQKDYIETMVTIKKALEEEVVSGLSHHEDKTPHWQLQKFSIGLGATGEIGIGPFTFGKALKQRFIYTR
jgi:hypothetical protein